MHKAATIQLLSAWIGFPSLIPKNADKRLPHLQVKQVTKAHTPDDYYRLRGKQPSSAVQGTVLASYCTTQSGRLIACWEAMSAEDYLLLKLPCCLCLQTKTNRNMKDHEAHEPPLCICVKLAIFIWGRVSKHDTCQRQERTSSGIPQLAVASTC